MKDRVCRMLRGAFQTRWGGAIFGFLSGACLMFICVLLDARLDGGFAGIDWATSAPAVVIYGGTVALAFSLIIPRELQTRRDRMIFGFLIVVYAVLFFALIGAVENDDGFAGIDWARSAAITAIFGVFGALIGLFANPRNLQQKLRDRSIFGFLVGVGMMFLFALTDTLDGSPADIGWGEAIGAVVVGGILAFVYGAFPPKSMRPALPDKPQ